jgi:general transcription factor 3C polypeptide 3 (transcription factor C subunit 4)
MRAVSIDPTNPLINLSLAIGYIHYALKRQSQNRQYLLTQGFAFMFKYYNERTKPSTSAFERQEAHFNMGRAYNIVGLAPLAIEYYRRVLEDEKIRPKDEDEGVMGREDLALEAAYNIRMICFLTGDLEGARAITDEWLVL